MKFHEILKKRREELGLTQKDIADMWGIKSVNISDWEHGKGMPEARRIPQLAKRLSLTISELMGEAPIPNDSPIASEDEIEILQYKGIGGSMGGGVMLRDQPGEIHGWRVTPEWIARNVKNHTGAINLRIVTGFGDSMRPLYNPGDPLLVDVGIRTIESDAIYFFRVGNEGFIKRLQRVPGVGLRVLSENKSYEAWTITPDMDFEVFAIVIKVWCGTDFW